MQTIIAHLICCKCHQVCDTETRMPRCYSNDQLICDSCATIFQGEEHKFQEGPNRRLDSIVKNCKQPKHRASLMEPLLDIFGLLVISAMLISLLLYLSNQFKLQKQTYQNTLSLISLSKNLVNSLHILNITNSNLTDADMLAFSAVGVFNGNNIADVRGNNISEIGLAILRSMNFRID